MVIGSKFNEQRVATRNSPQLISDIVKQSAIEILDDYFRFMDEDWDGKVEENVLPLIGKNVLTLDEAKEIAHQTSKKHPLCYLYKRGLIGVVEESANGNLRQIFQRAAIVNDSNRSTLPKSAAYLVHPLLESHILKARASTSMGKFQLAQGMVVGNGLEWNPSARAKSVTINLQANRVSLIIQRVNLSTVTKSNRTVTFSSLGDIPTAVFVSCLEAMLRQNSNNPSIDLVLNYIEAIVDDGYLKKKIRRSQTLKNTVDYLKECLSVEERYPALFETVNDRLKAYGLQDISISRSLRTSTMCVNGISWNEIDLVRQ